MTNSSTPHCAVNSTIPFLITAIALCGTAICAAQTDAVHRDVRSAWNAHQRIMREIDRQRHAAELGNAISPAGTAVETDSHSWQTHSSRQQTYKFSGSTLTRHERDGERVIWVVGPVTAGKWQIRKITIGDGENSETFKSIESVPKKYRKSVRALVRLGVPESFALNPQDGWNDWQLPREMTRPVAWNCLGGPWQDHRRSHNPQFGLQQ